MPKPGGALCRAGAGWPPTSHQHMWQCAKASWCWCCGHPWTPARASGHARRCDSPPPPRSLGSPPGRPYLDAHVEPRDAWGERARRAGNGDRGGALGLGVETGRVLSWLPEPLTHTIPCRPLMQFERGLACCIWIQPMQPPPAADPTTARPPARPRGSQPRAQAQAVTICIN